ncbi:MAG: hypothetical protein ABR520_04415 [Mycobacteriales bacterium]|nr:hypothetical protein [Frankia sp.]
MRVRLLVAVAAAATLLGAAPGLAIGQKPQITDPPGDALGSRASLDIVSGTFDTSGIVTKVGRRTTYTPKSFVGTLTLAGPPEAGPGYAYYLNADVAGCGGFQLAYAPGTVFASTVGAATLYTDCGSPPDETGSTSTLITVEATIAGNAIVWTVGLKSLPQEIKLGSVFSNLSAYTDIVEPVLGVIGPGYLTDVLWVDSATSDKTWKLG